MTKAEMINAFLLEYDLNGSGAVAGFEDSEIISFLDKAQLQVTEDVYLKHGPSQIYEVNRYSEHTLVNNAGFNTLLFDAALPTGYMYDIDVEVYMAIRSGLPAVAAASWVPATKIESRNASNFRHSVMNQLVLPEPVYYIEDGKVMVITDSRGDVVSSPAVNLILIYVDRPNEIVDLADTDEIELSIKWHHDIVNRAVYNAMAVTNDFRIRQTQNKSNE